jgi:hypothetical protein
MEPLDSMSQVEPAYACGDVTVHSPNRQVVEDPWASVVEVPDVEAGAVSLVAGAAVTLVVAEDKPVLFELEEQADMDIRRGTVPTRVARRPRVILKR